MKKETRNRFVWDELTTPNPDAETQYNAKVVGWTASHVPELDYTMLMQGAVPVAGIMALPDPAAKVEAR